MSSNKPTPHPQAREASTSAAEDVPLTGGPYEVGAELEEVSPSAGESSTHRANGDTDQRPPRSMCFLVEDCKYCRQPEDKSPGGDHCTLPEQQEESPAVDALRECLETMERDRLEAGLRRANCPTLIERFYLALRGKAV